MKAIKENWKLVLIVASGIVAVIFMCIFGIQGAQNKAFALEETGQLMQSVTVPGGDVIQIPYEKEEE